MSGRPRTFAWIAGIAGPEPQLLFDDPRVGGRLVILASREIEIDDDRSMRQLAAAYPAPKVD